VETRSAGEEALAISAWAQAHDLTGLGDPEQAGHAAHELLERGLLNLPLPAAGRTRDRIRALIAIGAADCVLARLAEGHADALAILAELSGPEAAPGKLWGVWAAQPPGAAALTAHSDSGQWWLEGDKPFCSGAGACDTALVTASSDQGNRLFAVDLRQGGVEALKGTWPALGMAGSDSRTVRFHRVAAVPVGRPAEYLERPGFWHGAVGVAACWLGGALGLARVLAAAGSHRELDPHAMAHLGAIDGSVTAMTSVLLQAADEIDLDPEDRQGRAALVARRARTVVETGATSIMLRVGRALGALPLTHDAAHSRRVADLTVYLRQSHAERDLADHGRRLLETGPEW
jgi:alkylation response protein AidB-like acyl-CoA dehydrogenase